MVKRREEVIAQFNEEVNMTVEELEKWLEDPQSTKAGTGAGLESGHKIIEILRKNPDKDPEKYDEDDIEHMRKVVGYTKRHLAQEKHLKETKTREELANAKSTISLKNWGHDPIKASDEENGDIAESSAQEFGAELATSSHDQSKTPDEIGAEETEKEGVDEVVVTKTASGSKKRKLGKDEPGAEVEADESDAVDVEKERVSEDFEESCGELSEEEHPRKKSKSGVP